MNRAYEIKLAYLVRYRFAGFWAAFGLGTTLTLILQSSTCLTRCAVHWPSIHEFGANALDMAVPLQASALFVDIMRSLLAEPWLALLFAAAITFMLYSSLVMVLLVSSIVAAQVIDAPAKLSLVLGVNIGSALIPVYTSRGSSNAK